ncbi:Hypothetical protein FKW44_017006 [Caligus rogercresseyi]|uniref:Uncharacterized protein n=1 Tax=Caligus rogercresseyi TaxID=217165 RepID=A0A7T8K1L6_CALRO|nr:Hypothetical protein FKW44_017006 [Caligus rogercresseyi]
MTDCRYKCRNTTHHSWTSRILLAGSLLIVILNPREVIKLERTMESATRHSKEMVR